MIRLITCCLTVLILQGCVNINESKKIIEKPEPFIFKSNELNLLAFDSCSNLLSFDTIQSVTKFRSFRDSFFHEPGNLNKKFCIFFNFRNSDSTRGEKLKINYTPPPFWRVEFSRTKKHLFINIFDSAYVLNVFGGGKGFYGGTINEMNQYVKDFYLFAGDTANRKGKFVNLHFPSDTAAYIETYLSQAIMGYVCAQRMLSLQYYQKELQHTTPEELLELRERLPFLFKLTYERKPKAKTEELKSADSLK